MLTSLQNIDYVLLCIFLSFHFHLTHFGRKRALPTVLNCWTLHIYYYKSNCLSCLPNQGINSGTKLWKILKHCPTINPILLRKQGPQPHRPMAHRILNNAYYTVTNVNTVTTYCFYCQYCHFCHYRHYCLMYFHTALLQLQTSADVFVLVS